MESKECFLKEKSREHGRLKVDVGAVQAKIGRGRRATLDFL